ITVRPETKARFGIALRIPGWCENPRVKVNGKAVKAGGDYLHIQRTWRDGDKIEIKFPMPIRLMRTSPRSRNNIGKIAIQRGPIVYCIEEADNGKDLHALLIDAKAKLKATYKPKLLGGVSVISGTARKVFSEDESLYTDHELPTRSVKFTAIPYAVWGNRKIGRMQ